ncbi:dihydroxyacetone kinase subunit DhaL, partial [Streptacidiphilus monticola]
MDLDLALAHAWIAAAAARVDAEADRLTALDAAIGDGDHGANLRRGFAAVRDAEGETPGEYLVSVGRTLISSVGGASGPLYGSAFRALGKALGESPAVDAARLGEGMAAAVAAVQRLGGAQPGDKTMVDALGPAAEAFAAR